MRLCSAQLLRCALQSEAYTEKISFPGVVITSVLGSWSMHPGAPISALWDLSSNTFSGASTSVSDGLDVECIVDGKPVPKAGTVCDVSVMRCCICGALCPKRGVPWVVPCPHAWRCCRPGGRTNSQCAGTWSCVLPGAQGIPWLVDHRGKGRGKPGLRTSHQRCRSALGLTSSGKSTPLLCSPFCC